MKSTFFAVALTLAFSASAQDESGAHDGLLPLTTSPLVNQAGSTTGSYTEYATAVITSTAANGVVTTVYSDINGVVGPSSTDAASTTTVDTESTTTAAPSNTGPNESEAHDGLLPLTTSPLTNSVGSTTGEYTEYATAVTTSSIAGGLTTIYSDISGIVVVGGSSPSTTADSSSASASSASASSASVTSASASSASASSGSASSASASSKSASSASASTSASTSTTASGTGANASSTASASSSAASASASGSSGQQNVAVAGLSFFGVLGAGLALL